MTEKQKQLAILTVNGGSSSIKFAVFLITEPLTLLLSGNVTDVHNKHAVIKSTRSGEQERTTYANAGVSPVQQVIDLVESELGHCPFAVAHRIVHGKKHTAPERITNTLIEELKEISAIDPQHLPAEIELIETLRTKYPDAAHVACFDTGFHSAMPKVAKWIAIPRPYFEKGIQRYGFHGLSYAFLMEELQRVAGQEAARGKIILAHLGSGASVTAVSDGKSIDTSMGFTPTSGIPMSTRTGDLDPGVINYLVNHEQLTLDQVNHMVNHESGLLGISQRSGDMRELLKHEATDSQAAEAIEFFCYQTRKCIGALAACLGGVDTLIFSGGIGEQSAVIRKRICSGLEFLGIEIDEERNKNNDAIISTANATAFVRVMKTNEEVMMAKLTQQLLNKTK